MKLPEFVNKILHSIALSEGFQKYNVIVESGSSHGDNIHGVLIAVKLFGTRVKCNQSPNEEAMHLMCKLAPASKECRESLQSAFIFRREMYLYTRVLPVFVAFQREKGLCEADSFLAFPKVYATHDDDENGHYAVIMEDIRARKFMLWPRHDPMPLAHEKLILEKLAKLHGVSLALKHQRPEIFDEFKELCDVAETQIEHGNFGNIIEDALEQAINILKNDEHKAIMHECKDNYRKILNDFFARDAIEQFGVINHGDCWINNCLFQYADNTREVENVCFIDWQFSRYSSPAPDVLYHIFSSTRKQLRDENYSELIQFYYGVLSDTIKKLGSDPEKIFRFSDLEIELKASGKFILIMGTLVVLYVLAQKKDIRYIVEYTEPLAANNNKNNIRAPSLLKTISDENDLRIVAINDLVGEVIAYGYNY